MELRVFQSDGSVTNYCGLMVELPDGVKQTKGVWQAFVRFPDEGRQNASGGVNLTTDGRFENHYAIS
jgi:hypothetical protein